MEDKLTLAGTVKPYYVYELHENDTMTGKTKVFYVGRGIGKRIENHGSVVLNKLKNGVDIVEEKEKVIADLLERRKQDPNCFLELVIGRYETVDEAIAVEATLIKWIYGKRNLTNKVHGSGHESIREFGNFDINHDLQPTGFSDERQSAIINQGIPERASELKVILEKLGFGPIECDYFGSQEYGAYWLVPNFPVEVQIKFQEGSDKVVLNARPSLQRKNLQNASIVNNYKEFLEIIDRAGYLISAKLDKGKVFAALFESNQKSRKKLNQSGKDFILDATNIQIEQFTSINGGIESSDAELIGNYLRDLQVRLTIAKQCQSNPAKDDLIKLFKSKPGNKFFPRNDVSEYIE